MNRFQAADAKNYVGSVSHSIEHLPKWYQIFAFSGILSVVYLRDNAVVSWLVVNLHNSFGTESIWDHDYQELLEQMSFNERLCFTLYGVALGGTVVLLYKMFCRENYGLGWSAPQLFPDRKGWSVFMSVVLCLVEVVRMRDLIAKCVGRQGSLANMAVHNFEGLEANGYDARLASQNVHFLVQVEVLKALVMDFVRERLPIIVFTGIFRVARDTPRRTHAALRWYMATAAVLAAIREVVRMYLTRSMDDAAAWATIVWSAAFLGAVNYIYGPSKRAGMVVSVTAGSSLSEAVRAVTRCTALWIISSLLVITVVVSVHVVELICLWLMVTLLTVWVPATIDSCSTDYMVLLTGAFSYLGHAMGYLTVRGSVRFGVLLVTWWMAASLLYNVAMNVSHNRYGGILAVLWLLCWIISPSREPADHASATGEHRLAGRDDATPAGEGTAAFGTSAFAAEPTAEVVTFVSERVRWMCKVADYDASEADTAASYTMAAPLEDGDAEGGGAAFSRAVGTALCISAVACVLNYVYARRVSNEMRLSMRRASIVLATPSVMCRKFVRTLVLAFCVTSFLASSWAFHAYALPHIVHFLPDFVSKGISVGVGCTVLGLLMDTKESMYDVIARVLGLLDPPRVGEDGTLTGDPAGAHSGFDYEESLSEESEDE